jgi:hypothetical protein
MSRPEDCPEWLLSFVRANFISVQPRAHTQTQTQTQTLPSSVAVAAIVLLLTAIWGLGIAAVVSLVPLQ